MGFQRMMRRLRRSISSPAVWLLLAAAPTAVAVNIQSAWSVTAEDENHPPVDTIAYQDGDQLEGVVGRFASTGGRVHFHPVDDAVDDYVVLENRMLERIDEAGRNGSLTDLWTVDGQITRYNDKFYLLLSTGHRVN